MTALQMARRLLVKQFERRTHRTNTTIAGTVDYRCNYHNPERTCLISPSENIKWTYGELWGQVMTVAAGLTKAGYGPGSVVATDLVGKSQSLLLQMAVAHNGMQLLTVSSEDEFKRSSIHVSGSVASSAASFLKGVTVPELQKSGGKPGPPAVDRNYTLAYYNCDIPTSNRQVYLHGVGIAGLLKLQPGEQVCIAASLNSSFGMGAVLSAVVRSATIYFPDSDLGDSAVLIADEQHIEEYRGKKNPALRAGLVKVGAYDYATGIPRISGSTEVAGIRVHELSAEGSHPLFDACSDTYYPLDVLS